MCFNILNFVRLTLIIFWSCNINNVGSIPNNLQQCPSAIAKTSPFPPRPISTPQPPYGCSQVNPLSIKDLTICFTNPELIKQRKMRRFNIPDQDPDIGVSVQQVIQNHGYPVETHFVTTADGYILSLIRIPSGKKSNKADSSTNKGPVLLQHGITFNSAVWIFNSPDNKSLAFLLADSGYDVWLGNSRGTLYSKGHTTLNAELDESYWDFSWHEMGKYDFPASIDYILTNYTIKQQKLFYIGHSLGTTIFFTGLSLNPSYNDKIKIGYLLAPTAYLGNSTNLTHWIVLASYFLEPLLQGLTKGQFLSTNLIVNYIRKYYPLCTINAITCSICIHGFFASFGFDYEQMNFERLPMIISHIPDTTSLKSLLHYGQSMTTGQFHQYDYGSRQNPKYYNGSCSPPLYNLKNVKAKIMTFWSWNDNFSTPPDVWKLSAELGSNVIIENIEIPHCAFNHADFIIGRDADKFIYKKIIKSMDGV